MTNLNEDLLGIKPISNAVEKTVDGVGTFLGKICMPVAEEIGLLLQDKVKVWRASNANKVVNKAKEILEHQGSLDGKTVHPLLAWRIIEHGSFADTDEVQTFWAGLLASSCTILSDDSNQIFIDILSQLTKIQVKIIEYSCTNAKVFLTNHGFLQAEELIIDFAKVMEIAADTEIHRVDRELDRMRGLGLFGVYAGGGGFDATTGLAIITPSALCLQLYARCQGNSDNPAEFYKAEKKV